MPSTFRDVPVGVGSAGSRCVVFGPARSRLAPGPAALRFAAVGLSLALACAPSPPAAAPSPPAPETEAQAEAGLALLDGVPSSAPAAGEPAEPSPDAVSGADPAPGSGGDDGLDADIAAL